MTVTILQIAQRVNLSHTTVSRVLHGKPGTPIAPKTRQRVIQAAQEMGYRPNLAARSMRDSKSNLVAVFASPIVGVWSGLAPRIVQAIAPTLHQRGMELFFAFSPDDEGETQTGLPPWHYDAAVILQKPPTGVLEQVRASGRPSVAVNELVPEMPCILADEANGIEQSVGYLFSLGHRRIAYANASCDFHMLHYSVEERQAAYIQALQKRGLVPVIGWNVHPPDRDRIGLLRQCFVEGGATAVLAYDHVVALDIVRAASALRLRIPEDISLVCFNDVFPLERLYPPVTVIDPNGEEMGRMAAERLLEFLDGTLSEERPIYRVPMEMTIRESVRQIS